MGCSAGSLLFMQSVTQAQGMVPPIFRVGLFTPVNTVKMVLPRQAQRPRDLGNPHWHVQRLVSGVLLAYFYLIQMYQLTKLTIGINYHGYQVGRGSKGMNT